MTQKNPLWRCLALYKNMPLRFATTALLFVALNAGLAWQQWLVGRAVDDVQQGHAVERLADGSFDLTGLERWIVLLIGVAVARGVLQYIAGVFALVIGQELLYVLRQRILVQVQRLDLAYHWRHGVGEVVTRTTRDADKVRDALINFWRQVFEAALVLLAAVGLLAWYNPWLGFVPLLLTLTGISIFVAQTNTLVTLDRAVGAAYDRVNQDLSEGVHGVRVIKSFALEQRRIDIFTDHVAAFVNHARAALAYSSMHIPIPQLVVASSHIWILGFGAQLVQQGRLSIGELIASLLVANTLVFRIEGVGRVMQVFADARSSAARIWDLLDAPSAIQSGTQTVPDGPLGLRLEGVSAHAPNGSTAILDRCDLEVAPGEVVALVGSTGSGKSTLAGLLARLLEHSGGRVSIGSPWAGWQDIRRLQLDALRHKVHVVPQEAFLFSDSLESNLRLGNPRATDDAVWQALELADARGFVERLPEGLHTRMGDRGVTLSGGQRQRICLARAILARPAILVLDDATSALDALTERRVLDHIRSLRTDAGQPVTTVLIASKLSTLLLADRVAMLSQGRIAAEGTHAALLAGNADYRDLLGDHHHGH